MKDLEFSFHERQKLRGVQLSAMCVPDIRGTQGTFSFFTTRAIDKNAKYGGEVQVVVRKGDRIHGELIGPNHPLRKDRAPLSVPFIVTIRARDDAVLQINGAKFELQKDKYTEWINISYRVFPGTRVRGVCRFLLLGTEPDFELYATPVNIDPEKPAMPIGYPAVYPVYLANRQGPSGVWPYS